MKNSANKALIGIGNIARADDALGWKFLEQFGAESEEGWDKIYRYQLNVEDAELVSKLDTVIFVDSFNGKLDKGFLFESCHAHTDFEYSTHALNPCAVLGLCHSLYKKWPKTYVIKIQGYQWGLEEGLSPRAAKNLEKALSYFRRKYSTSILKEK